MSNNINDPPPSEYFQGIYYNPSFFQSNNYITYAYGTTNYLSRVNTATSIASTTTFAGQVIINNGLISNYVNSTSYLDVAGNDILYAINTISGNLNYAIQYEQSLSGTVFYNNQQIQNEFNYFSLYLSSLSGNLNNSLSYVYNYMTTISSVVYNNYNIAGNTENFIYNYAISLSSVVNSNYFIAGGSSNFLYNYAISLSGQVFYYNQSNNALLNYDTNAIISLSGRTYYLSQYGQSLSGHVYSYYQINGGSSNFVYNYAITLSSVVYSNYQLYGNQINNNNLFISTLSSDLYIGNANQINIKDSGSYNGSCYFPFVEGPSYPFNTSNNYSNLVSDSGLYYNPLNQALYSTYFYGTLQGSSTQCNQCISILPILDSSGSTSATNYYLLYCLLDPNNATYRQARNNGQLYWQNLSQSLTLPNLNALGNTNLNALYTIGNNLNISGSLTLNSTLICNNNITLQTASSYILPSTNQLGYTISHSLLVIFTQSGFNSLFQLFGPGYINGVGTYQVLCDIAVQGSGSDPAEILLIGVSLSASELNDGVNTPISTNSQIEGFYSDTLNPYNFPIVGINNGGALSFSYLTLNFIYTITTNTLSQPIYVTQCNDSTYGNFTKNVKYHYYITRIA